ncbi:MAG: zf-HC2 domain-containing protein [Candidatus Binataceae bacterium]
MNCFEARTEFVPFWRRTLTPAKRDAFNAHLRECARCEHAFRVFALSAPVLHSQAEPEASGGAGNLSVIRPRMPHSRNRTGVRHYTGARPLAAASAALAMVAAAVLAIYVVSVPPYQSLANTLTDDSAVVETVNYVPGATLFDQDLLGPDFTTNLADGGLLGQDTPAEDVTIPGLTAPNPSAHTNNLAG